MTEGGAGPEATGGVAASRLAYVVGTFLLTAAAVAGTALAGPGDPAAVAAGATAAWAIQAVAFWTLVGALDAGREVLRTWVAGIGARAGGLVLALVAGTITPLPIANLALAYAAAALVLLLMEAVWLALRRRPVEERGRTDPREREDGIGAR